MAEAADGIEALAAIEQTQPDVVLLDLRMPRLEGAGTLKALAERDFRPPVLVLTTFDDDEAVLDVLRAGARGFLLKDVTLDELVHAIETLARGGRLVQPAVTAALLQRLADRPAAHDEHPAAQALTTREVEILELMAGGFANREIARAAPRRRNSQEPCVIDPAQARRPRPHPRRLRGLELDLFRGGAR